MEEGGKENEKDKMGRGRSNVSDLDVGSGDRDLRSEELTELELVEGLVDLKDQEWDKRWEEERERIWIGKSFPREFAEGDVFEI